MRLLYSTYTNRVRPDGKAAGSDPGSRLVLLLHQQNLMLGLVEEHQPARLEVVRASLGSPFPTGRLHCLLLCWPFYTVLILTRL